MKTEFYSGQFWLQPPNNKAWFSKTFLKARKK